MSPMQEIIKLSNKLPQEVLSDINSRLTDWFASGGKEDDPYVEQQLRFAKHFVKIESVD